MNTPTLYNQATSMSVEQQIANAQAKKVAEEKEAFEAGLQQQHHFLWLDQASTKHHLNSLEQQAAKLDTEARNLAQSFSNNLNNNHLKIIALLAESYSIRKQLHYARTGRNDYNGQ